jgi:tRNA-specific 2-thiouridylase
VKKTVAVALSGGLDSAAAATLLTEKNYRVVGLHFLTGYEPAPTDSVSSSTLSRPVLRAQRAAEQIGIPLEVVDCSQLFKTEVVEYFIDSYRSGQTPNPCVVCNQRIKFGLVLEQAKALGASVLATGHYARIQKESDGRCYLLKGTDTSKDQSYFLARLTQQQLSQAIFPLGTFTKKRVREMANAWGFTSFVQGESQELCFIRHPSYKDFLVNLRGFPREPGDIVNTRGDILGRHGGLHAYTIGQRRGIGIPGPEPYYVLRLDVRENILVIGSEAELTATECTVTDVNWIGIDPPDKPVSVKTRIRYRHQETESVITPMNGDSVRVSFSTAQCAITPGQNAVFYQGERVLGGGWIAP